MISTEQRIVDELQDKIKYFQINNMTNFYQSNLYQVYNSGLINKLSEYVDKYLSLSKKQDYEFLGSGSTAACFRVGDYAVKLISKKWSKNQIICPDLYLILKTYERDYVRNSSDDVIGGLEVLPFLSRSARDIPYEILLQYREELKQMKYKLTDSLIKGVNGDNAMLLDSYKDADSNDPESLPTWFKKYPLVLVDRDKVERIK